jgi:hypothetical protein
MAEQRSCTHCHSVRRGVLGDTLWRRAGVRARRLGDGHPQAGQRCSQRPRYGLWHSWLVEALAVGVRLAAWLGRQERREVERDARRGGAAAYGIIRNVRVVSWWVFAAM